jgi:hypothetical protein
MKTNYKIYDTEDEGLFAMIGSHYFKVSDSREVYQQSMKNECKDDCILKDKKG